MVFVFTLIFALLSPAPSQANALMSVGKKVWQDRFDSRCFTKAKIKGQKVTRLWRAQYHDSFYLPPVADDQGNILVLSDSGVLIILNKSGKQIAKTIAMGRVSQPPLVLDDNTIVIVTQEKGIYFFNPDGTFKSILAVNTMLKDGVVPTGNNIAIATHERSLIIVKSNGGVQKTIKFQDDISTPPVIRPDGSIAVAIDDSSIHIFDTRGRRLKKRTFNSRSRASAMASGLNGEIAVVIFPRTIQIINDDGSLGESIGIGGNPQHPPVFLSKDRLAVSLGDFVDQIQFIKTDGSDDTTYTMGDGHYATHTPLVAKDGTVVAVSKKGDLFFLTPLGSLKGRFMLGPATAGTRLPVLLNDGTAVIGWEDGGIYFVNTDGSLHGKFELRDKNSRSQLLALADDRVVAATNSGEIFMIKLSTKERLRHLVWQTSDCPTSDLKAD